MKDAKFRKHVRKFLAIPFLPESMNGTCFAVLKKEALKTVPDSAPFIKYFENEWMKRTTPKWNVQDRVRRTINELEGWHLRLRNGL